MINLWINNEQLGENFSYDELSSILKKMTTKKNDDGEIMDFNIYINIEEIE